MKKCTYCGKEYPDEAARCLIDNELLSGGESQPSTGAEETANSATPPPLIVASIPITTWTERQLCIFEIALVCAIAFGGSILASGQALLFDPIRASSESSGTYRWLHSCLSEASALGLLWYVLMRRGKSFSSLGLAWEWKDIGRSIALLVGGSIVFYSFYAAIHFAGLTAVSHEASTVRVANGLFGRGISIVTILFLFLNPFFEELIVRGYLMTEIKMLTKSTAKAIIASTVLQTSYHFYQGVPLALADGAAFLLFSIYYAKTNRIAPIILAHLYCDVGSTLWYLFR